ncbi:MAG: SCO family protein [Dehalococcoidia bacterium]
MAEAVTAGRFERWRRLWRAIILPLNAVALLPVIVGGVIVGARLLGDETSDAQPPDARYEGAALERPAPDFSLIDQDGQSVALTDLRGKVVVLAFMDSRCDDTCPLTAQELRLTANVLGSRVDERVAFVAINVNRNFNRPEDVALFTREQHLDEIPGWRFLTGPPEWLEPVWTAYNINVQPPSEPGEDDFQHSPGVYVIDQQGNLVRHVSVPLLEDPSIPTWDGRPLRELLELHVRKLLEQ